MGIISSVSKAVSGAAKSVYSALTSSKPTATAQAAQNKAISGSTGGVVMTKTGGVSTSNVKAYVAKYGGVPVSTTTTTKKSSGGGGGGSSSGGGTVVQTPQGGMSVAPTNVVMTPQGGVSQVTQQSNLASQSVAAQQAARQAAFTQQVFSAQGVSQPNALMSAIEQNKAQQAELAQYNKVWVPPKEGAYGLGGHYVYKDSEGNIFGEETNIYGGKTAAQVAAEEKALDKDFLAKAKEKLLHKIEKAGQAGGGAGYASGGFAVGSMAAGVGGAVIDTASSIRHPVQSVKGMYTMVTHPVQSAKEISQRASVNPYYSIGYIAGLLGVSKGTSEATGFALRGFKGKVDPAVLERAVARSDVESTVVRGITKEATISKLKLAEFEKAELVGQFKAGRIIREVDVDIVAKNAIDRATINKGMPTRHIKIYEVLNQNGELITRYAVGKVEVSKGIYTYKQNLLSGGAGKVTEGGAGYLQSINLGIEKGRVTSLGKSLDIFKGTSKEVPGARLTKGGWTGFKARTITGEGYTWEGPLARGTKLKPITDKLTMEVLGAKYGKYPARATKFEGLDTLKSVSLEGKKVGTTGIIRVIKEWKSEGKGISSKFIEPIEFGKARPKGKLISEMWATKPVTPMAPRTDFFKSTPIVTTPKGGQSLVSLPRIVTGEATLGTSEFIGKGTGYPEASFDLSAIPASKMGPTIKMGLLEGARRVNRDVTIPNIGVYTDGGMKMKTTSRTDTSLVGVQSSKLKNDLILVNPTKEEQKPVIRHHHATINMQAPALDQGLAQSTVVRQRQVMQPRLGFRYTQRPVYTPIVTVRTPQIVLPKQTMVQRYTEPFKTISRPKQSLYVAEARRYGKWMPVSKANPYGRSLMIGAEKTRKTLGASFRLREAGTGKLVALKPFGEFGKSKSGKDPFSLIQSRSKRLSHPLEVAEIKGARRKKAKVYKGKRSSIWSLK